MNANETTRPISPVGADPEHGVVLFDGVCNMCNAAVNHVIDRDPRDFFRFASLQSDAGRSLAAAHGIDPQELSTIVYVEGGRGYVRSSAVLRICRRLDGASGLLWLLIVVPAPLRDLGYRLIAKNRYRLLGKREACRLPTEADRRRFLADPA